jgi:hypothetical protein
MENVQKFKPTLAQKAGVVAATGYMALVDLLQMLRVNLRLIQVLLLQQLRVALLLYRLSDLLF